MILITMEEGMLLMSESLAGKAKKKYQFKDYPDVLTVQQTAELLSVCKNTIYKMIRGDDLPYRRIGSAIRIRKKDVLNYMQI